ncbi:MAG: hypothetical protein RLZ58_1475 [Pseudomonadota bacterium]
MTGRSHVPTLQAVRERTRSTGAVHPALLALALLMLLALLLVLGTLVGSAGLQWPGSAADAVAQRIAFEIRLPRTLGAVLVGALLGLAGAVAQGLFRNPLADPFLLGSASGAALGVALALAMWGVSPLAVQALARLGVTGAAFAGAMLGVLLTLALSRGVQHTLRLLLAGVIVGVVLGASKDLITLARPDVLQGLQGFTLGHTGFIGWGACALMAAVLLPLLVLAWVLGPLLDGLSLGEPTAQSLGLPLAPLRMALVAALALATGTAVAQAGLIAFVGLAAPHLVRAMVRTTHAALTLLSALAGAVLLAAADIAARTVVAPAEWPVGVMTAVLGGGYLLWRMHRGGLRSSGGTA